MKKIVSNVSMLVNINIPNQVPFLGFIDEKGKQWIILKSFIDSIGLPDKIYRKHQLPKIKRFDEEGLGLLLLRPITGYKNNSNGYLLEKDFFFNNYLLHEIFWKIDNHFLYAFRKVKNIIKYKKEVNELFSQKHSFSSLFKDINKELYSDSSPNNNLDTQNISDNNSAQNNIANIDIDKLNKLINTAVQNSIENNLPKIVDSMMDLFLRLAPGPGTKHYYADKLTTIQPDSTKYFSIRDFLTEKKVSLVFLKLFGGVVAAHYGKVAIKYIPPNGNEKSSYNYYPISYKPLIDQLFIQFTQSLNFGEENEEKEKNEEK